MGRVHYAWVVAGVAFATLVAAAGFRAAPGVLMVPLHEAGWSISTMSAAVSVNLVLYGLIAPFAAALMDRFGIRRVVCVGLLLIAAGAGLSVLATTAWHLILTWGLLIGAGTGSMAMVFAATVANAWFVKRRGLVMGVLTAGGAAGQLVFLPLVAYLVEVTDWKVASLIVAAAALAVLPLAVALLRDRPSDVGLPPYGGEAVINLRRLKNVTVFLAMSNQLLEKICFVCHKAAKVSQNSHSGKNTGHFILCVYRRF